MSIGVIGGGQRRRDSPGLGCRRAGAGKSVHDGRQVGLHVVKVARVQACHQIGHHRALVVGRGAGFGGVGRPEQGDLDILALSDAQPCHADRRLVIAGGHFVGGGNRRLVGPVAEVAVDPVEDGLCRLLVGLGLREPADFDVGQVHAQRGLIGSKSHVCPEGVDGAVGADGGERRHHLIHPAAVRSADEIAVFRGQARWSRGVELDHGKQGDVVRRVVKVLDLSLVVGGPIERRRVVAQMRCVLRLHQQIHVDVGVLMKCGGRLGDLQLVGRFVGQNGKWRVVQRVDNAVAVVVVVPWVGDAVTVGVQRAGVLGGPIGVPLGHVIHSVQVGIAHLGVGGPRRIVQRESLQLQRVGDGVAVAVGVVVVGAQAAFGQVVHAVLVLVIGGRQPAGDDGTVADVGGHRVRLSQLSRRCLKLRRVQGRQSDSLINRQRRLLLRCQAIQRPGRRAGLQQWAEHKNHGHADRDRDVAGSAADHDRGQGGESKEQGG